MTKRLIKPTITVVNFAISGEFFENKGDSNPNEMSDFKGYLYFDYYTGIIKGAIHDKYGDSIIQGKLKILENGQGLIVFYKIYNIEHYFIYALHGCSPPKENYQQKTLYYQGGFRTDSFINPYCGQVKMRLFYQGEEKVDAALMTYAESQYPEGSFMTDRSQPNIFFVDCPRGQEVCLEVEVNGKPFISSSVISDNIDRLVRIEMQKKYQT